MKHVLASLFLVTASPFALAQETEPTTPPLTPSDPLDDEPLDEIVLVPNRLETVRVIGLQQDGVPVYSASVVTILREDDLAARDTGYVADQLRAVPGLAVSRSGAAGGLTQVRLRGAEANHTLVLLNGVDISDPLTGETDFGLVSGLSPSKIEVARGEQSTFLGSGAIGGVINIETASDTAAAASAEIGSFDTRRLGGQFGLGDVYSGKSVSVFLSDSATDGVDTSGLGGEADGSDSSSVLATGTYTFNNDVTLSGLVRWARSTVETDPDSNFDGRLENADRETESEQLTLGLVVGADAFGFQHRLSADWNDLKRENFGDGANLNTANGTRTRLSASSKAYFWSVPGGDLSFGGLIDHRIEDYSARDTEFGGFTNQDRSFSATGIAAEAEYYLGSDWALGASVRQDFNDGRFDDATSWRLGVSKDIDVVGTWGSRLRASVGSGVKNPTFTELFGFFPGSFIGNPDVTPERSTSAEIGLDVTGDMIGTYTVASLTVFHAKLDDEIVTRFLPGFLSTVENSENTSRRTGVEASVDVELTGTLDLSTSLSWIDSNVSGGTAEIRVPEWTGSLVLTWRPEGDDGASLGLALDYVGRTFDTDFGTFQRVELGDYPLLSARAEWPLTDRVSLTLRGENLLDREVRDVFGFAQAGAAGFVGLKLR